jgi:hypothetical protein
MPTRDRIPSLEMIQQASATDEPISSWRLEAGVALFLLSIVLPIASLIVLPTLGLSGAMTASVSGALLLVSEGLGVSGVAIMGKPGYLYMKGRVSGFLKQYGPPKEVSRRRYNIGLVLFWVPIAFGWLSIYLVDWIPGFADYPLAYALGGDFILLLSLFVLGGDFWAKIRALFVYSDRICSATARH